MKLIIPTRSSSSSRSYGSRKILSGATYLSHDGPSVNCNLLVMERKFTNSSSGIVNSDNVPTALCCCGVLKADFFWFSLLVFDK